MFNLLALFLSHSTPLSLREGLGVRLFSFPTAKLLLFSPTTKNRASVRCKNLLTKWGVRVKKDKPYIWQEQTIYLHFAKLWFADWKQLIFVCSQLREITVKRLDEASKRTNEQLNSFV